MEEKQKVSLEKYARSAPVCDKDHISKDASMSADDASMINPELGGSKKRCITYDEILELQDILGFDHGISYEDALKLVDPNILIEEGTSLSAVADKIVKEIRSD